MAVTNVACPYCGRETLATLPEGKKVKSVHPWDASISHDWEVAAACQNCGEKFHVVVTSK